MSSPLNVTVVLGTRPEAIKLGPVARELMARGDRIVTRVVSTGQHREMLDPMLELFMTRFLMFILTTYYEDTCLCRGLFPLVLARRFALSCRRYRRLKNMYLPQLTTDCLSYTLATFRQGSVKCIFGNPG